MVVWEAAEESLEKKMGNWRDVLEDTETYQAERLKK